MVSPSSAHAGRRKSARTRRRCPVVSSNRFHRRAAGGLGVGRGMDITGSDGRPLPAPQPACNACIGVAMKQFLITLLAVGVLASAAQADARLVSKRAECVAACGTATAQTCGWITKRGRYNYCRAKLINKCKRFGVDVMCPPPPAPPVTTTPTTLPIVTPTTVPVVVTTTTTPYIPPTTTTLPPVALDWTGFWSFTGTKVQDSCPPGIADTYFGETFSIV